MARRRVEAYARGRPRPTSRKHPLSLLESTTAPLAAKTPPHLATLVVLSGTAAAAMNMSLPVFPAIAADFGVSDARVQLVLTLFLAMTGLAQLFIGPLADRYGRRPVLLVTATIYVIATIVCAVAPSLEWLLFGRILAATVAAQIALSRAIVRDLYDRSKAASMIGYVTMAMAVVPMVSPTIGGLIGEWYGWRATFWVLDGLGIIVLILIWTDLGETHAAEHKPWAQQFSEYGSLLREPMVWAYFLCATAASGAYFAFLGGAPFVGARIIGMSPSALGMHFALVAIGYMIGNFISGRFSERIGIEPMMLYGGLVGAAGVAIALALMSVFEPHAMFLFAPMALVGVGNGMVLPNSTAGALSVRPELAGSASGIGGFVQIGGGAALATVAGNLITVENDAMPLYVTMFCASMIGAIVAAFMYRRARSRIAA